MWGEKKKIHKNPIRANLNCLLESVDEELFFSHIVQSSLYSRCQLYYCNDM